MLSRHYLLWFNFVKEIMVIIVYVVILFCDYSKHNPLPAGAPFLYLQKIENL